MKASAILHFDVLILGSGLAGQSLALRLADTRRVALVTKRALTDSASAWAQGGIAAVLDPADSSTPTSATPPMPAPACAIRPRRASSSSTAAKPSTG
jgi:aspartate oxidase